MVPPAVADPEERVCQLAASQHGVVTRQQLFDAGITPAQLKHRVRRRRLRPLHRGVYAVGPLELPLTRVVAAVLACAPDAYVSHRSAAALLELLPGPDASSPVDITVVGGDRGRRPGVRAHCVEALDPHEVTKLHGVPATTPSRTLLDLAGVVASRELEQALANAERRGLVSREDLRSFVSRRGGRRGARALLELIRDDTPAALVRSRAEEVLLALIDKAKLPRPLTNVVVAGHEVDMYWRNERLVVEVDGYAFHSSRHHFERDRWRDATLAAAGIQVVRLTWRQIATEPEAVLVILARALLMGDLLPSRTRSTAT